MPPETILDPLAEAAAGVIETRFAAQFPAMRSTIDASRGDLIEATAGAARSGASVAIGNVMHRLGRNDARFDALDQQLGDIVKTRRHLSERMRTMSAGSSPKPGHADLIVKVLACHV